MWRSKQCRSCGNWSEGEEGFAHCPVCGARFDGVDIPAAVTAGSTLISGAAARQIVIEEHNYTTRDNGVREGFHTGSQRDTRKGKGRFDLIWWPMLERVAQLMERGAEKYGERNWELGQPVMRSIDSLLRHVGQIIKREEDEDHFAAVWFNAMSAAYVLAMIRLGKLPPDLDDRP